MKITSGLQFFFTMFFTLFISLELSHAASTILPETTEQPSRAEFSKLILADGPEKLFNGIFQYKFGDKFEGGERFTLENETWEVGKIKGIDTTSNPELFAETAKITNGIYTFKPSEGLRMEVKTYTTTIPWGNNYKSTFALSTDKNGIIIGYFFKDLPAFDVIDPIYPKLRTLINSKVVSLDDGRYVDNETGTTLILGSANDIYCHTMRGTLLADALVAAVKNIQERERQIKDVTAKVAAKYKDVGFGQWVGKMTEDEFKLMFPDSSANNKSTILIWTPDFKNYHLSPAVSNLTRDRKYEDEAYLGYFVDNRLVSLQITISRPKIDATTKAINDNYGGETKEFSTDVDYYDAQRGVYKQKHHFTVTLGKNNECIFIVTTKQGGESYLLIVGKHFYDTLLKYGEEMEAGQQKEVQEKQKSLI